jgi:hypothetical protein
MLIRPISQLSRSVTLSGTLAFAIAATLPIVLSASAALAQTPAKPLSNSAKLQQTSASVSRGAPSRRFGGGSRTTTVCATGSHAMAMIAPADNVTLTTAAQPSLMFWVSESNQARDVEFVLRDASDRSVYSKLIKLPKQAGLVTLDMAQLADAPKLDQNQDYYLYLSMICDGSDRAKDMVVEGALRRVDAGSVLAQVQSSNSALSALPQSSDSLARAERYSELGLWHDAMAQLNRLRQSNANPALQQQAERQWLDQLNADKDLSKIALETRQILRPVAVVDATDSEAF